MIISRSTVTADQNSTIEYLAKKMAISVDLALLLFNRGITTPLEAEIFLNPSKQHLLDPFLLKGVSQAISRLNQAKANNEVVIIYGDYDVDGICATTVLTKCLKIFGIEPISVVPERADGYGLTTKLLDRLLENYFPDLIITVDCGISGHKQVEYLQNLGVDVIVTDHHELPDVLPNCTVINCKIKDQDYPFDSLCGAGVAYKLGRALIGEQADSFLDYVALATIADSMPLLNENRHIVHTGLNLIKTNAKPAIKKLLEYSNIKDMNSTSVAFSIAPKINAGGRMGDANSALKLMLSSDQMEIDSLCEKLNNYNSQRQIDCDLLYKSAKAKLKDKDVTSKIIILEDQTWKNGLIGIVASRLAEEYNKPVILMANNNGRLHGSARSIENINIHQALTASKQFIVEFGGHAQAAGVTVNINDLDNLEASLNDYLTKNYNLETFVRKTYVEYFITDNVSIEFVREVERLQPFGVGNKTPLFAISSQNLTAKQLKPQSPHLIFKNNKLDFLYFNGVKYLNQLNSREPKNVVFELSLSYFQNKEYLKAIVREIDVETKGDKNTELDLLAFNLKQSGDNELYKSLTTNQCNAMLEQGINDVYGTLFVINNPQNLKYFPLAKKLESSLFAPTTSGNVNSLVFALEQGGDVAYQKVVYLDKPIFGVNNHSANQEIYANEQLTQLQNTRLSTDRQTFADIFNFYKNFNITFSSTANIAQRCTLNYSTEQVIFVLEVFIELGIFKVNLGHLCLDNKVKSNLNLSKIFKRVIGDVYV